jgi:hypothetical protein
MIKSILIPATGDVFDDSVLETALRVAQLAPAHIELRYFCERFGEVAENVCHIGSAISGATLSALASLDQQIEQQSTRAARVSPRLSAQGHCLARGRSTFDQRDGELACVARWPRQPRPPGPPH